MSAVFSSSYGGIITAHKSSPKSDHSFPGDGVSLLYASVGFREGCQLRLFDGDYFQSIKGIREHFL